MKSFKEVINRWGTIWNLAHPLNVPESRVRQWRRVDSIPCSYWKQLLKLAKKDGIPLTANKLIDLADKKR